MSSAAATWRARSSADAAAGSSRLSAPSQPEVLGKYSSAVVTSPPPVTGSRGELLVVYSFVNSILANVPEARGVVLMWNGSQRPTFAGHVDTTRPLPAERKWLAQMAG